MKSEETLLLGQNCLTFCLQHSVFCFKELLFVLTSLTENIQYWQWTDKNLVSCSLFTDFSWRIRICWRMLTPISFIFIWRRKFQGWFSSASCLPNPLFVSLDVSTHLRALYRWVYEMSLSGQLDHFLSICYSLLFYCHCYSQNKLKCVRHIWMCEAQAEKQFMVDFFPPVIQFTKPRSGGGLQTSVMRLLPVIRLLVSKRPRASASCPWI